MTPADKLAAVFKAAKRALLSASAPTQGRKTPEWHVQPGIVYLQTELTSAPTPQHGINCPKVPHTRNGYLHDEADDSPYDVDGVMYCGRCHLWLSAPAPTLTWGQDQALLESGQAMHDAIENRSTEKADMASRKWKEITKC